MTTKTRERDLLIQVEPAFVSTIVRPHKADEVRPGVALAHKGRWPKLDTAATNVNILNAGERTDMGESSSVHGTLVRVTAA